MCQVVSYLSKLLIMRIGTFNYVVTCTFSESFEEITHLFISGKEKRETGIFSFAKAAKNNKLCGL